MPFDLLLFLFRCASFEEVLPKRNKIIKSTGSPIKIFVKQASVFIHVHKRDKFFSPRFDYLLL